MTAPPALLLRALFDAAVAGASPGPATRRVVAGLDLGEGAPLHLLALGKAAHSMAAAALAAALSCRWRPAGGAVVGVDVQAAVLGLATAAGDHPIPGARSLAAATLVERAVARMPRGETAVVLLSGGASSLVAAPVAGVEPASLAWLFERLHEAGLDIAAANAIRKRFLLHGAGRLAIGLAGRRVVCLALSDVRGDDLATIGSGPCTADRLHAADVRDRLGAAGLLAGLPPDLGRHLDEVERGERAETPKPGHPAFAQVDARVIVGAADALAAAAAEAGRLGVEARRRPDFLDGEAAAAGARVARELLALPADRPVALLWSAEPTVARPAGGGAGGRAQELALAAARVLHDAGAAAHGVALLAAGTDGRDGPTDAAGAIVDGATWAAVVRAGRDPARDLAAHDSHPALDAAGALVRTGPTGTNVMDVVVGVRRPA